MSFLLKNFRNVSKILRVTNDGVVKIGRRSMGETAPVKGSTLKFSLLGLGFGTIVGTGYSIHKLNQPRGHIINDGEAVISTIDNVPQHKPSKQIQIAGDDSGLKLTLYQYRTCPFCCKVRSFLDYHGISYDIIEVDPVLKQSIKWSEYKKVPILLAKVGDSYQPLNDSTMIVSVLSSYLQNKTGSKEIPDLVKFYPRIKFMDEGGAVKSEIMNRYFLMLDQSDSKRSVEDITEERKWRKWADDVLVHMLSPNVYRTKNEALQSFNWFSEVGEWEKHFPAWERYLIIYVGAAAMWGIGKRLKKKYNLKDDVRQSLYDECNHFARAVNVKGTPFIGGNKPNLGDLAVYGVLSSIEGCDAFKDLLIHSNIKKWYYNMRTEVENHQGSSYA